MCLLSQSSRNLLTMKLVNCPCRYLANAKEPHTVADFCIVADSLYSLFIEVVSSTELILYALLQLNKSIVGIFRVICRVKK